MRAPAPPTLTVRLGLALLCGVVVAVLAAVAFAASVPLILTSWASSMGLITTATGTPPAAPWRVAGGHLVSGAVGLGFVLVAGPHDLAQLAAAPLPQQLAAAALIGLAVAVAVAAMWLTGALHPPAAANPAIALVSPLAAGLPYAALVTGGALVLGLVALLLHRLRERQAPGTVPPG